MCPDVVWRLVPDGWERIEFEPVQSTPTEEDRDA
jgi:hypothetical protein